MGDLTDVVDLIVGALALSRGLAAPCEVVRRGPLWVLRDTGAAARRPRTTEVFAYGAPPEAVAEELGRCEGLGRFALEPFLGEDDSAEAAKQAYRALGFRLGHSEALFHLALDGRAPQASEWAVRRVASLEEAARVSREVYGRAFRRLRAEDLAGDSPAITMHWVDVGGRAVAAARSVSPRPGAACLHDVQTVPELRGRGVATALLNAILADDERRGVRQSALLATAAGARLYPRVGYRRVGLLQIYGPV